MTPLFCSHMLTWIYNTSAQGGRSVIPIAVTGGAAGNLLGGEKVNFYLPDVLDGNEECQEAWNAVSNLVITPVLT